MSSSNGFKGIIGKSRRFLVAFHSNRIPFQISIKYLHSLHDSHTRRKPTKKFVRKRKDPPKLDKTLNPEKICYTRNIVSNIYNILKYSTWESAGEQLKSLRIKWDSHVVTKVLKAHPPMQKAWLFFNWASNLKGFKHDQFTYTTMLDIFGEAGRISSMYFVFDQMKERDIEIDTVTYTSLMHWVSSSGDIDEAMRLWKEMGENGCEPTVVSYTAYLKILLDNGRVEEGIDVYKEMIQSKIPPNCHTYTVLMGYLIGAGKCREALDMLQKMQESGVIPDKAACNILIEKSCQVGETEVINQILLYMKQNRLVLRYPVFCKALETLRAARESDALLREANPHICLELPTGKAGEIERVSDDAAGSIDRGVIYILLKKQNLIAVDLLLDGMVSRELKLDSFTLSDIIESNCDRYRLDGALLAFDYSLKMGLYLQKPAYLALIGTLMRLDEFPRVVDIVREMVNAQHCLGAFSSAMLIHKLGFGRRPRLAAEVFDLLPDDQKGTAEFTALISVYLSAGAPEKAIKIYRDMKEKGIDPSLGTINVLSTGLENDGKFCEEAEKLRKEKKNLVNSHSFRENIPAQEKICNLLFSGTM